LTWDCGFISFDTLEVSKEQTKSVCFFEAFFVLCEMFVFASQTLNWRLVIVFCGMSESKDQPTY